MKAQNICKPTKCGRDVGRYGMEACNNYWPIKCGIDLILCLTCGHRESCHKDRK